MATLTGQSIASSYEQLLHVDTDGGGNTTTLVPVKDGDNGTTFAMQLSTTTVCIDNPTADSSTQGGILRLQSDDGALMQSGSRLGVIEFAGAEDSSSTITVGGRIESVTDAAWSASENGADMVFYTTDGDASQSEVMRLTADNLVGIGMTPISKLHIKQSATDYYGILIEESASDAWIRMGHNGTHGVIHTTYNTSHDTPTPLILGTHSHQAVQLVLATDGNVGIGDSSPDSLLHLKASTPVLTFKDSDTSGVNFGGGIEFKDSAGVKRYSMSLVSGNAHLDMQSAAKKIILTTADGNGLEIDSTGDVTFTGDLIMADGKGIDFSADASPAAGMTAEILDDYEEGTWIPVVSDGTNPMTMHSSYDEGYYTKIGNLVTVSGYITTTSLGSASGDIRITGLPFTVANNSAAYVSSAMGYGSGLNITAGHSITIFPEINDTYLKIWIWDAATGTTAMQASEWSSNGECMISLTYRAA